MADTTPIVDLVIADLRERDRIGREHYGDVLRVSTPIDPLRYRYEELLDAAMYSRLEMAIRPLLQADYESLKAEVSKLRSELVDTKSRLTSMTESRERNAARARELEARLEKATAKPTACPTCGRVGNYSVLNGAALTTDCPEHYPVEEEPRRG